jgi:hypothetical protein
MDVTKLFISPCLDHAAFLSAPESISRDGKTYQKSAWDASLQRIVYLLK